MTTIINISGKIFKVSTEIIRRSQLFDTMMTDCNIEGEIIIDRSVKLFKHMYAFLLDPNYPYPKKYYSELDYYLVSYDKESLYDPNAKILEDLKIIKADIKQINRNIMTVEEGIKNMRRNFVTIEENIEAIKDEVELSDRICKEYYCESKCIRGKSTCRVHTF
uniref:Potassium channel tetramerisation-type BTB domain-containing protein n=1 Tax=viral metagenome TaxID=1070528 RepID=A0A6C0C6J8_9ZZZZ